MNVFTHLFIYLFICQGQQNNESEIRLPAIRWKKYLT